MASTPRFDGGDEALSPGAVRAAVLRGIRPMQPRAIPLADAAGLVLAEDVRAPVELPRFANSAMDGFAVRADDVNDAGHAVTLRVVGRAFAGRPWAGRVGAGEAVAIATGAPVPAGADAIVPVEDATVREGAVDVAGPVVQGRHVRRSGEDVRAGDVVLARGQVVAAGQLAAAAALGLADLPVHPRPRATVVATGDEIRPPGAPLDAGQVHDAVSVALDALLREAGATVVARTPEGRPVIADEPGALRDALRDAARVADVVVTVGGVSRGERDPVRAISWTGDVQAVDVALRPARPFAFGEVDGARVFCLPGNPGAALASFEELVRPAIRLLLGRAPTVRRSVRATLTEAFEQRPGRLHLVPAEVWRDGLTLIARAITSSGSGSIAALARASGWLVVEPDVHTLPAGAEIEVRLLVDEP